MNFSFFSLTIISFLSSLFLFSFQPVVGARNLPPHAATGGVAAAVQVDTLWRSSLAWDGQRYTAYPSGPPELTVTKITIPANTVLPWHLHPMPNAAYVLSGTLTIERKSDKKKTILTAGQACAEVMNKFHRGKTGGEPVVLIVFYAGTAGMPTTLPFKIKK